MSREAPGQGSSDLTRTLGFFEAVTIGAGTMIGAGIFLFPGIAGGQAGMAAIISFAIGGVIAMTVAAAAAELATAMPRSGGPYAYVTEALGSGAGTVVGLGQWLGLVFASAFYLTGFSEYLLRILDELGLHGPLEGRWIAAGLGLLLMALSILGTRKAGRLQNVAVVILLLILSGFLGYGLVREGFLEASPGPPGPFAPQGYGAVMPTAALVFTSYLGFIQITTVAGDIKDPGKNLPRALFGSIALATVLYLLTVFLTTSILPASRLRDLGETALTEVGRSLLGSAGAFLLFGAGLLATLSSANASILSASRAVFALGRDGTLPRLVGKVHPSLETPHFSLVLSAVPVAAVALVGRLETLAEVASTLHLLLYGLVCLSLIVLRTRRARDPERQHDPPYRSSFYPLSPVLGGLAGFGLMAWMSPAALLISGAVLVGALLWHGAYARSRKGKAPS